MTRLQAKVKIIGNEIRQFSSLRFSNIDRVHLYEHIRK